MSHRLSLLTAFWYGRVLLFVLLISMGVVVVRSLPTLQIAAGGLMLIGASILTEQSRAGGTWFTLGLHPRFMGKQILWGIALAAGGLGIVGGVALLLGATVQFHPEALSIVPLGTVFLFVSVSAVSEELVFRGVIFQAIYERFGGVIAVSLLSFLFSIAHIVNPFWSVGALINIILAGILLSEMYIVTRSLWLPIAFHIFWNFIQYFLLGSKVSGLYFGQPLIEIHAAPTVLSRLLIGGGFGIEEGLVATIVLTIIIGVCTLPALAQVSPELAAQLFRRQYLESDLRHRYRHPFCSRPRLTENS